MTARDVPHNVLFTDVPGQTMAVGPLRARTQVLAEDRVRYYGEPIALIAADTEEIAEQARDLVTVEYEDLPGVFDPVEAMRPDAPQLEDTGNVISRWKVRRGDTDQAFRAAHMIADMAPGDLNKVLFCNSGSEAADTSMKVALAYHRARGEGHGPQRAGQHNRQHNKPQNQNQPQLPTALDRDTRHRQEHAR